MVVNSLELARRLKTCKWNTHFHRKVSNGKTGLPFQNFHSFQKFSSGTSQKHVFHLHPNRNFRDLFVNGKHPITIFVTRYSPRLLFRLGYKLTFIRTNGSH